MWVGQVATVWTLTDYQLVQTADGTSFLSAKSRNRFDCANETRQQLVTVRYSLRGGEGESVYSNNDVQEVRSVGPGSLADGMLKLVCSRRDSLAKSPWIKFGENERLIAYYEHSTERRGGTVVAWVLFDYKSEQESPRSGRRYLSEKGQHEVDCQGGKSRTMFVTWHAGQMGNGKVVYTGSSPMQWEPHSPGGIGRALGAAVCP